MARKPPLFTWGTIQFEVLPTNVSEVHHSTQTDWSRKEIAGAAMYREWVGEGEEELQLSGKLFPHFMAKHLRQIGSRGAGTTPNSNEASGGLITLEILDDMRRRGQAHLLVRGDGWAFGWFVIERLSRAHTFLGADGIGQQVAFEAIFHRVPVPTDPGSYFETLFRPTRLVGN